MYNNIPQETIDAVLKHHDIVDIVARYVHLTKQGKNYKGLCPFHSEKTPSFTVTPEKQIFHCFGCGAGGNAIKFVMNAEGYTFPEAVKTLAEDAGIAVTWEPAPAEETEQQIQRKKLLEAHELTAKWFNYLLKNTEYGRAALQYLRARGFTDKTIDMFQIGYAPPLWDTLLQFLTKRGFEPEMLDKGGLLSAKTDKSGYVDRFRDRIMFPIWNEKGQIIAFSGRLMAEGQPKYLNSPETVLFHKSRTLYNIHQAKSEIRKTGKAVMLEGFVDVIKAWEAGVFQAVATMGTALTEEHAQMLKRLADEVILCYDGDSAGQAAAYKTIGLLERYGCKVGVAMLPTGVDPDEYVTQHGMEAFRNQIIASAVPSTKFKLIYLQRGHILQEDEGKLNYSRAALKVIAQLSSPVEREIYLKSLSSELGISIETLKQDLFVIMQEMQKKDRIRDNNENTWNNVMNDKPVRDLKPALLPAFQSAERHLLALMISSREVAEYVRDRLGDQFNVEAHAALAVYLYTYYAQGHEPDPSKYIASLQDDKLESAASSISFMEFDMDWTTQVVDDYIREVKKFPKQKEIERQKDEMIRAERSGDVLKAAQIASEIIALERQLKTL